MKRIFCVIATCLLIANTAHASIRSKNVDYTSSDGTKMQGYVAYDDSIKSHRPGILIVHDWMGIGQFTKNKADQLASQGYVAFAVDIYGKENNPTSTDEAAKISTKYKSNRALLRAHIRAAYDKLTTMKQVDAQKILVMGYCFGGTTALELARSGAQLVGTVSFHGGLSSPTPQDAKNIHGRVLALHGADDPMVKAAEVEAFKKEMADADVDLTFVSYPGAVHAFTNPNADSYHITGIAYNADADNNSWKEFEKFLKEVF